jgi:hypothetical protein
VEIELIAMATGARIVPRFEVRAGCSVLLQHAWCRWPHTCQNRMVRCSVLGSLSVQELEPNLSEQPIRALVCAHVPPAQISQMLAMITHPTLVYVSA